MCRTGVVDDDLLVLDRERDQRLELRACRAATNNTHAHHSHEYSRAGRADGVKLRWICSRRMKSITFSTKSTFLV